MQLAGIDLAWHSSKNPTALAVGSLRDRVITLESIAGDLFGVDAIATYLSELPDLSGIAIDAPLIIRNTTGQRACETLIGKEYGSRHAACHTSNLTLYPKEKTDSVLLSRLLASRGYQHLGETDAKWQIECYPHPALIEMFKLEKRHSYKKGRVSEKRRGQCELAELLLGLSQSSVLRLTVMTLAVHPG